MDDLFSATMTSEQNINIIEISFWNIYFLLSVAGGFGSSLYAGCKVLSLFFSKKKYNKIKSNIVQRYKPELSTEERIADYEEKVSLEGLYKLSIVSDKLEEHEKSC